MLDEEMGLDRLVNAVPELAIELYGAIRNVVRSPVVSNHKSSVKK